MQFTGGLRIIEFITDKSKINSFLVDEYQQYILNNLVNPKEIWRYSFNNQIGYLDQCLLITLFSFTSGCNERHLISCFESRLEYERKAHNQIVQSDQFNNSIKILLDGFVNSEITDISIGDRFYRFINPSLNDFFIGHLLESYQERKSLVSSIVYLEQLNRFKPHISVLPLEKDLQIIIRDKIANKEFKIIESESSLVNESYENIIIIKTLCEYCKDTNIDSLLLEHIKIIDFSRLSGNIIYKLDFVLRNLGDSPLTIEYIKINFIDIIENIMLHVDDIDIANNLPLFFEKYGFDYNEYIQSENGLNKLIDVVQRVLTSSEDSIQYEKEDSIYSYDEVNNLYKELNEIEKDLITTLFPSRSVTYDFKIEPNYDCWEDKIYENRAKLEYEEFQAEAYIESHYNDLRSTEINEDAAIDDLFIKNL